MKDKGQKFVFYPLSFRPYSKNDIFAPPAPVVQWIELWFPVPSIGVRIPSGAQ
jgi:hypothetical protein